MNDEYGCLSVLETKSSSNGNRKIRIILVRHVGVDSSSRREHLSVTPHGSVGQGDSRERCGTGVGIGQSMRAVLPWRAAWHRTLHSTLWRCRVGMHYATAAVCVVIAMCHAIRKCGVPRGPASGRRRPLQPECKARIQIINDEAMRRRGVEYSCLPALAGLRFRSARQGLAFTIMCWFR